MKNFFLTISLLVPLTLICQNLTPSDSWVAGPTTNLAGYSQIGQNNGSENIIENGLNPFDVGAPVWRVIPASSGTFRGLETDPEFSSSEINVQEDYRFSIWVKLINGAGGKLIALLRGTNSTDFLNSSGAAVKDPYFNWSGTLATGDWYLMVGFVQGMNSTYDYLTESGFYDLQGQRVSGLLGPGIHKFNTTTPEFSIVCQLNNIGGTGENMAFFDPRFEQVNGNEPTIAELVSGTTQIGGNGAWATNTNGVHYNDGNVGIGTEDPGSDWKLAVNGKIRSKEIKVETGWADYVFEKDYPLPTLQEVEKHIAEKGHLINIPSAAEVEANGIELGEMNKLLLEKIEELTLYILKQEEELKKLPELEERLKKLERKLK